MFVKSERKKFKLINKSRSLKVFKLIIALSEK